MLKIELPRVPRTHPDRVRLPLTFDPARLQADLARLEGIEWTEHFVRQNYEGDWSALPLRADKDAIHPILRIYRSPSATEFVDTEFLALTPYFQEVLRSFQSPIDCVRLMRLTPGSEIKQHNDFDLAVEDGWARIHVPITTNPGVSFHVNDAPVTMLPGEAWYLRLADPHRARNDGDTTRVHMVIDTAVNDWLLEQLAG